jgi:Uma2 family endonuclease
MSTVTRQKPSKARVKTKPAVEIPDRSAGEMRIAIRGVEWKVYDLLSDAVGEGQHIRMAYDGKDLEIMTTGRIHEYFKDLFGQFVVFVCNELRIRRSPVGETTWKRSELSRGLEADQCYYFLPAKLAADARSRALGSMDIADYPNPDLAIEIDISQPEIDRESIYESLRVAEIWRFDGREVMIQQLGPDGTYVRADMSRFLPVKAVEIRRWIVEEDSNDQEAWFRRLRAWLRRISRTRKPQAKRTRRRKNDA